MKKACAFLLTFLTAATVFTSPTLAEVRIGDEFGKGTVRLGPNFSIGSFTTFGQVLSPVVWTVYGIIGTIIIIVLLYGGTLVIMGSDPKKLEQGKQAITWGLIGLIVLFSSFWIIRIVEVMTGLNILNPTI